MDYTDVRLKIKVFFLWVNISFVFLILPALLVFGFKPYYFIRFEKLGVYSEFSQINIPRDKVNEKFEEVIDYVFLSRRSIDINFFSKEDTIHLQDVRNIFIALLITTTVLILDLAIRINSYRKNIKILSRYSLYYIIFFTVFTLLVVSFFNDFFVLFHRIIFINNYWLLNPATSNLIKIFPEQIFYELFIIVSIANVFLHAIFLLLGKTLNEKSSRK